MSLANIVILDDNKSYNKLLKVSLEKEGFHVTSYFDSEQAVKEIPSLNCDLIISDYMMPKLNGSEVAESLKDLNIPIWILSASNDPQLIKKSYNSGVIRFKFKDENRSNLIEDIFLYIQNRKKQPPQPKKDANYFTAYTPQFSNSYFKIRKNKDFIEFQAEDEIPKGSLIQINSNEIDDISLIKVEHIEFNDDCTFTHTCSKISKEPL